LVEAAPKTERFSRWDSGHVLETDEDIAAYLNAWDAGFVTRALPSASACTLSRCLRALPGQFPCFVP